MTTRKDVVSPGPPPQTRTTNVSWRYRQQGSAYEVTRVECVEGTPTWTCSERVVLEDAPPPPTSVTFTPGTTSPTWALKVANPQAANDGSYDPTGAVPGVAPSDAKGARRVIVSVDGGGDQAGTGGGAAAISLTASASSRTSSLNPDALPPPTIGSLVSRCGGNFGLLVDTSGSIGDTNMSSVRNGLTALKEVFQGTPVKIQLVDFDNRAYPLDNGARSVEGGGHNMKSIPRWYDMLDPNEVTKLQNSIDVLESGGATNYEEGFYRSFRNDDGTEQEQIPTTLLFFTDGQVRGSRRTHTYGTNPSLDPPEVNLEVDATDKQDQMNRADYWAGLYRGTTTRMIGVGVGIITSDPDFNKALAQLVSGTDTGTPAVLSGGKYVNADVANLFITPDWDMFSTAVESVALGMCGGTVTVQTVTQSGSPLGVPVSYKNTAVVDSEGASASVNPAVLTTQPGYPSATFDFSVPGGDYVDVTLAPADVDDLAMYQPVGWSCTVRGVNRVITTTPIGETIWSSMTVRVHANDPISCKLTVSPI